MSNIYEYTRKRVTTFYNNKNMSDKEIIEALSKEIEQYRNKIRMLEGNTYRIVETERKRFKCGADYGDTEYEVIKYYIGGELIKEEIKPAKYPPI